MYQRTILWLLLAISFQPAKSQNEPGVSTIHYDFCGTPLHFSFNKESLQQSACTLSQQTVADFYIRVNASPYQSMIAALQAYKEKYHPDDWLFYQLIRKTAQIISPKSEDYTRYTMYKWFLLIKTGYDAYITVSGEKLLLYIRSDEEVYDIPVRVNDGRQYVCLNYHDYGAIDFTLLHFVQTTVPEASAKQVFSYKIKNLPSFSPQDYQEKDLHFTYYDNDYHFKVKLNPQLITLFNNYPTVDYASQLNIPLSQETYLSLIPLLKKNVKGMSVKKGVDYLMRFTRYAFLFEVDTKSFGTEKRLSPEQTLFFEQSDCEDRVALFFYLVKEIYNLPMIVLEYPKHVTIAVQFDKPKGKTIEYNGNKYSICEPTPQKEDLPIGKMLASLRKTHYQVVYQYSPQ
ncbi:hypothetical protein [Paraflavitalea sp. CAU 1676]|uniref:hypothetical protein n=1 Tax=Paraflavitalea sp. CAU 1676 TaxID=3032598 RepID=UPI0023DC46B8|nr:hypothetical protein [Paraflavitalea sp. CAU 1676]MDF2187244.1 hypothetical protein [Paraflavitalea sp. CAU 1676]